MVILRAGSFLCNIEETVHDAGSQLPPEAPGYQRLAEPRTQAQRGFIDREPATAIVDQGFRMLGVTVAVLFDQVEQVPELVGRQGGEQGALPAVWISMPAQREF